MNKMIIIIVVFAILVTIIINSNSSEDKTKITDKDVNQKESEVEVVKEVKKEVVKKRVEEKVVPEVEPKPVSENSNILNKVSREIFLATNSVRTNPSLYSSDFIEPYHNSIVENNGQSYIPGKIRLLLNEGKKATSELITFLEKASSREALVYEVSLEMAAKDHAIDIGKNGVINHTGSDGSNVGQRLKRYTTWSAVGENISFGTEGGHNVVRSLLIDDGVKSRGHRDNIMNTNFTKMGAYCTEHKSQFKYVCVIVYAD